MSEAAKLEQAKAIAFNEEFYYQLERGGYWPLKGTDYIAVREEARTKAEQWVAQNKSGIRHSGGNKIYRQKRVNKSRRVSNRRRRNKSRKTKRIR